MPRTTSTKSRRSPQPPESRGGADITEHRLGNGLRVLVAERHLDPVVAVMLFYRVGARDETEREAGLSHFLEHMMFKGSAAFGKGAVDEVTARLGGQNNAFTGYDHTAYWFEFASDRWEQALAMEADRMGGLLLEPAEFDSEREVVLEELAMGEDDPWTALAKRVEAALFQRHAYGRPIIGTTQSLGGTSVDDMRAFHRRFYVPANATLVVCGDVTPTAALRAARRHFGHLPTSPAPERPFAPVLEEPAGEVRLEMRWPDPGKRLCMAWPTVPVGSREDDLLDVILTLLTTGRRALLQRRLVLDGDLATSVSSNDTRVDGGAFWLMVDATSAADAAEVEAAVNEELEYLRTERLPLREIRRAVDLLAASEAYEAETVSDLANELGGFAVDADWRLALDTRGRLCDLKPVEVRDAAAKFLDRRRRVVGWSLPDDSRFDV
ncbi:M16 family metallopeptidase [Engelhardtia mirabilis]|uniref:M16 family metallopeptidase n=1 Tax=Engelhardtia mirabilis TaxID=2528011 RepID=UPI001188FBB6|nr:Protease 3 precursor [Planctomycetes bacterium Pla86]